MTASSPRALHRPAPSAPTAPHPRVSRTGIRARAANIATSLLSAADLLAATNRFAGDAPCTTMTSLAAPAAISSWRAVIAELDARDLAPGLAATHSFRVCSLSRE